MAGVYTLPYMPPRSGRGASHKSPVTAYHTHLLRSMEHLARVVEQLCADVEKLTEEQAVQIKRTGQLQAELDAAKKAWERMQSV